MNGCINWIDLPALHTLEIGTNCFIKVKKFGLGNLPSLKTIQIGDGSFRSEQEDDENLPSFCRITNCPKLRKLNFPHRSFTSFKAFELSNVDSLQLIDMGNYSFANSDLLLKGRK